jgi:large subunit ribosomal protein L4
MSMQGSASTKTRAEVSGGGRKPLKQKGTGQARKGSTRTPLRPGGGISFGPKPRDWTIKMNKKERRLAMGTALQSAADDMVVVDSFATLEEEPKTRALVKICKNIGVDVMAEHALIITGAKNDLVKRCGKNVERLKINQSDGLNVYDVLRADKIIIEEDALQVMHERYC